MDRARAQLDGRDRDAGACTCPGLTGIPGIRRIGDVGGAGASTDSSCFGKAEAESPSPDAKMKKQQQQQQQKKSRSRVTKRINLGILGLRNTNLDGLEIKCVLIVNQIVIAWIT